MDVKTTPRAGPPTARHAGGPAHGGTHGHGPPPADAGPVVAANGADAAAPVQSEWPIRIKLQKPIRDRHANPTDVIEFREPNAGDLMAVGDPATLSFDTNQFVFDANKLAPLMARLSSTPMPFIQEMSVSDYQTCKIALMRFFLPDLGRLVSSSTATD